jgi:hypothetical protein
MIDQGNLPCVKILALWLLAARLLLSPSAASCIRFQNVLSSWPLPLPQLSLMVPFDLCFVLPVQSSHN